MTKDDDTAALIERAEEWARTERVPIPTIDGTLLAPASPSDARLLVLDLTAALSRAQAYIDELRAALGWMVDAGREASIALGELGFTTNDLTAAAENAIPLLEPRHD